VHPYNFSIENFFLNPSRLTDKYILVY